MQPATRDDDMTEKERVERYWPRPVVEHLKEMLLIELTQKSDRRALPVSLEGGCVLYRLNALEE